jgi:hypothetical protein
MQKNKCQYNCVKATISIERKSEPILPEGQDGQTVKEVCRIETYDVDFIDVLLKDTGCKQHTSVGDIIRIAIEIHPTSKLIEKE